jgi:hypothetical protein
MADERNQNPTTGAESDISKSQSQQQPPSQASQASQGQQTGSESRQLESGQQDNAEAIGDQAATGQSRPGEASGAGPDEGMQGDTLAQQRTDVEGGSLESEASSGFVGAQGQQDTSSKLVREEDEEFGKDGQGAPEGK